jgi:hypothetical protein
VKDYKVIKKIMKARCWSCEGRGCKACNFTGQWREEIYYHVLKDKTGQLIAFDSDTLG